MIVAQRFKEDNNTDFQWLQHDHYPEAIRIIFNACRDHYIQKQIDAPENEYVTKLRNLTSFDHRLLQDFHDHLAAYWRKRFLNSETSPHVNIEKWLIWLQDQMKKQDFLNEIYISICFLSIDEYKNDQVKDMLQSLQSHASKKYPLKLSDHINKIPSENLLNLIYLSIAAAWGIWIFQISFENFVNFSGLIFFFTVIFSGLGIYAYRKKLHELGSYNVNSWFIKLISLLLISFGLAFFFVGLMDFTK